MFSPLPPAHPSLPERLFPSDRKFHLSPKLGILTAIFGPILLGFFFQPPALAFFCFSSVYECQWYIVLAGKHALCIQLFASIFVSWYIFIIQLGRYFYLEKRLEILQHPRTPPPFVFFFPSRNISFSRCSSLLFFQSGKSSRLLKLPSLFSFLNHPFTFPNFLMVLFTLP